MAQESRGQPRREQFRARMVEQLGAESAAALEESLKSSSVGERRSLRLNPLKGATPAHFEHCGFEFLGFVPHDRYGYWVNLPENYESAPALGAGLGYLQDIGSMEVVAKLDPQPGELVLDLCAAPGGKSTHILERLGTDGWLVSNDPVRARAERLNALVARNGSSRVSILAQDPDSISARYANVFDKILVDAPSSGESFFAKRDDKRLDVPDAEVAGCARRQFLILDRAAQMCRSGGQIVYSTATYSRAENSDLVRSFLEAHADFVLVEEQYRFPHTDNVPGGYWAVLKHTGPRSESQFAQLRNVSGLLRQGVCKWDAEVDAYALSMLAPGMSPEIMEPRTEYPVEPKNFSDAKRFFSAGVLELSDENAKLYLLGQALPLVHTKGLCVVNWRSHPLGYGKSTGDRINNLIPKILRAQR